MKKEIIISRKLKKKYYKKLLDFSKNSKYLFILKN